MITSKKITTSYLMILTIFSFGIFAACDSGSSSVAPDPETGEVSYDYAFNEGQLLGDANTAYRGDHARNLNAELTIEERADGNANVTITLRNTVDGVTYPVHAHDAADPSTTPNGTPYNETPNGDVFAGAIAGNGGSASMTNETEISWVELTEEYGAFLVVHDPTQDISTTDLATYLVLGIFAQDLEEGEANLRSMSFEYSFNEGQLLDNPDTAYEGEHNRDLSATLTLNERIDGTTEVIVMLNNTVDGETYPVHSHDAADPNTTPNGTPYNETPNGDVFAGGVMASGMSGTADNISPMSFNELTRDYNGFLVVHDPLQDISTTDLTTYLILGLTAR